jgi:hypothetical protein
MLFFWPVNGYQAFKHCFKQDMGTGLFLFAAIAVPAGEAQGSAHQSGGGGQSEPEPPLLSGHLV